MSSDKPTIKEEDREEVPAAPMVSTPELRIRGGDQPKCTFEAKRYDGKQNWQVYLQHFHRTFNLNGWPQQMKKDYLLYLLDGEESHRQLFEDLTMQLFMIKESKILNQI